MKILIVMAGFFPGKRYGGPPVSVDNFCSLMKGNDCYIVTRNHDLDEEDPYPNCSAEWNDRGNCKVSYLSDAEYSVGAFERIIRQLQPDLLYLQGVFQSCIVPCLWLAKKYGVKTVLAPRGELCKGAFRKKYKKLPYIAVLHALGLLKNVQFQSTSEEETEVIHTYLRASCDRIHFLPNIPSLPPVKYPSREKKSGSARIVFLSRIHSKKNLLGAIEVLRRVKGTIWFDIYGPLEDKEYWGECQNAIATLPEWITVTYCGMVSHDEVHRVFSEYDAFLFPTYSENYGHVIAEALTVGCPVIISDQTPWNDVNDYRAGWALPLENVEAFVKAVQEIVTCDSDEYRMRALQYMDEKSNLQQLRKEYSSVFTQ